MQLQPPIRRRLSARSPLSGFGVVEILCAVVVLTVSAAAFCEAMIGGLRMADETRERARALEQVRRVVEELQDASFAQVFALYDASKSDDPGGAGTAPGPSFAVSGLRPLEGDTDGLVGSIEFPVIGTQLREDVSLDDLGMPQDLDGDGVVDSANHAANYQLLPVLVRASWQGPSCPMHVELRTMLAQR